MRMLQQNPAHPVLPEAAKRGIRVLPDTSLNHTGNDSVYFNRFGNHGSVGAFQGGKINPQSPYADWYTLDASLKPLSSSYLGDADAVKARAEAVAKQTEKK